MKIIIIIINSSCNYHVIPLTMINFWDNYKDIIDQVIILCVIAVIQYYADIHYYKTPCQISNLSGEKYVENLIQQNHPGHIQEIF